MATLLAMIDDFNPKWDDFGKVMEKGNSNEIYDWMLENCPCEHEQIPTDEIYDDVLLQDAEWMVTFRDVMCNSAYLYEF